MALIHEEIAPRPPLAQEATTTLMREAIDETRQLVRIEVALAKDEARGELRDLKAAAVAFSVAIVATVIVLSALVSSVVVAFGVLAGAIVGVVALVVAVIMGVTGYRRLPMNPLVATRKRLEDDVQGLKEHVA